MDAPPAILDDSRFNLVHQEPNGQVQLVEREHCFQQAMTRHFGQRFLDYRKKWALSSRYEFLPEFPLSLDFESNASCNLSCIMCVMGSAGYKNNMVSEPLMSRELYGRIMEEAGDNGLPAMTFGFLSEPLLRKDLPEMIARAREAGVMDIRLGTNGMLLTNAVSRDLIDCGLTRLEVSIDAFKPKTYGRIRRGGRLETVVDNVLNFMEARQKLGADFPVLRLSFLKLPFNERELDDFMEFWAEKADLFSIQEPIYFEEAPISRELDFIKHEIGDRYECVQPWQRMIVRSNGDVLPCCSIYGMEFKAGSFKKKSIKELWKGEFMSGLRLMHKSGRYEENGICRHCAERSMLKGFIPEVGVR